MLALFALPYYIFPSKSVCVLMRHRNGIDLDGRGRGRKTVIRIHYVRKKSISNKRGK